MQVLRVTLQLACYVHLSRAMKSSCIVPPVRLGDEATLSCHFEEDISKVQLDVLVYLYKGDTQYPVVIYSWHDGQAKIQTMEGYRYEGKISDHLVIKIMNVNESNAVQYSCFVALSKDQPTSCALKIIDASVVAVVGKDPTLFDADSTVKMSSFMSTEKYAFQAHNIFDEHYEGDKNKLHTTAVVIGVVFGVAVVKFFTTLIFAIYKRWIPIRGCTHSVLNGADDSVNSNIESKKDIYKPPSIDKTNIKIDIDQQQSLIV